ncbi:hypothetical protein K438DRAFT_1759276 [Mycena galopus ATCC 62051]|nr:hypothetical protein K438DRAFT_1759276 [Mycena galopus ATCC 62051]
MNVAGSLNPRESEAARGCCVSRAMLLLDAASRVRGSFSSWRRRGCRKDRLEMDGPVGTSMNEELPLPTESAQGLPPLGPGPGFSLMYYVSYQIKYIIADSDAYLLPADKHISRRFVKSDARMLPQAQG